MYYFCTSTVLSNREHFYYKIVYPTSSISLDDTTAVLIRHTRKSASETEIHNTGRNGWDSQPGLSDCGLTLVSLPILSDQLPRATATIADKQETGVLHLP